MGLQQPPREDRTGRVFVRIVVLAVLVVAAGALVWAFTVDGRIDLVEDVTIESLELDPATFVTIDDLDIRVVELTEGAAPVILLHDLDVSGAVIFDQLAPLIQGDLRAVTIDLPGFGLSERMPEPGTPHTVGAMAAVVADVIATRYGQPVILMGVGLGGKVAAEVAVVRPEAVSGLVMVDVDFWQNLGWRERISRWPLVGRPVTFTFDGAGSRGLATWAPHCAEGGWCPTEAQLQKRSVTATIVDSTDSIHAFRETPAASFVPSDLDTITVPVAYVWSSNGVVPRGSVDRISAEIPGMTVTEVDAWMAHVESPESVLSAIQAVAG
jgi:pimeloyl-ACP methyl ester carboxylesterase